MFPIPFNFPFRKKDGAITTIDDAIASGGTPYVLPTASATVKGGVKVGDGLEIDENGVLSTSGGGGSTKYIHNIILKTPVTVIDPNPYSIQVVITNESAEPFTLLSLNTWLTENGYPNTLYDKPYPAYGVIDNNKIACGISGVASGAAGQYLKIGIITTTTAGAILFTDKELTITDNVS